MCEFVVVHFTLVYSSGCFVYRPDGREGACAGEHRAVERDECFEPVVGGFERLLDVLQVTCLMMQYMKE